MEKASHCRHLQTNPKNIPFQCQDHLTFHVQEKSNVSEKSVITSIKAKFTESDSNPADYSIQKICNNNVMQNLELSKNLNHPDIFVIYENSGETIINTDNYNSFSTDYVRPKCCGYNCDVEFSCAGCPEQDFSYFSIVFKKKFEEQSSRRLFETGVSEVRSVEKVRAKREISSLIPAISGCEEWTDWMSSSTPSGITLAGKTVSGGEYENFARLRSKYDFCKTSDVVAIDCRVKGTKIHWTQSGDESIICDYKWGFRCDNRAQAGKCKDYEVKFYCSCDYTVQFFAGYENGVTLNGINLHELKPVDRSEAVDEPASEGGTCVAGWTDWFDNSLGDEKIELIINMQGSCENPLNIECRVTDGGENKYVHKKVSELDQSGFYAKYTCDLDVGMKCKQEAPCKPCKPIETRLYCPCTNESLWEAPVTTTTALPTTLDASKMVSCCKNSNCTEFEECYGSCWSTVEFGIDTVSETVFEKERRFGCEFTTCTKNYESLDCYFMNPRQTEMICSECCGGMEGKFYDKNIMLGSHFDGCNYGGLEFEDEVLTNLFTRMSQVGYSGGTRIGFGLGLAVLLVVHRYASSF